MNTRFFPGFQSYFDKYSNWGKLPIAEKEPSAIKISHPLLSKEK
jgi:hypothetical protein